MEFMMFQSALSVSTMCYFRQCSRGGLSDRAADKMWGSRTRVIVAKLQARAE